MKSRKISYISFEDARKHVRSLNIKNKDDWNIWTKSDARPRDIPAAPAVVYKDEWLGWGDFLGIYSIYELKVVWVLLSDWINQALL